MPSLDMNSETDAPPPRYSDDRQTGSPPEYFAGDTYTIGGTTLDTPLVRSSHIRAHLSLLRAIIDLKATVEAGEDPRIPPNARALPYAQRWAWFVGLAVERFFLWLPTIRRVPLKEWVREELPPKDVLMVWQAYLLNPIFYAEDCARRPELSGLAELSGRLLSALVEVRDIAAHIPSATLQSLWLCKTQTLYDPFDAMADTKQHNIQCLQCLTTFGVPFLGPDGTGYLQQKFSALCPGCNLQISKETLGAMKFARDLVIDSKNEEDVVKFGPGVFMAGTYYTTRGPSAEKAEGVKAMLQAAHPLRKPSNTPNMTRREWEQHIIQTAQYSMHTIRTVIISMFTGKGYNAQRVVSAYADDRPFSVDLVGSTVRLSAFAERMYQLQWTDEHHFTNDAEDELMLQHAIKRYYGFLNLVASMPQTLLVPTLDIDLVWHTHQMMGSNYIAHSAKYLGILYDHHDVVEQNCLLFAFDATCRAWRDRFNLAYVYCGCPLPDEGVSDRLSRIKHKVSRSVFGPTGDLVPPLRLDAILATHPSDHNAFYIGARTEDAQRRLIKRQLKASRKGQELVDRTHEQAFLRPLDVYDGAEPGCIISAGSLSPYSWVTGAGGGHDGSLVGATISKGREGQKANSMVVMNYTPAGLAY